MKMTNEEQKRRHLYDTVKAAAERLEGCTAELKMLNDMPYLSFELKEKCREYYKNEIQAIMDNPYIYDKIMGLKMGGII